MACCRFFASAASDRFAAADGGFEKLFELRPERETHESSVLFGFEVRSKPASEIARSANPAHSENSPQAAAAGSGRIRFPCRSGRGTLADRPVELSHDA